MRGLALRLGGPIVALALLSQFLIPPILEHRLAGRLTQHGGTAHVELGAIPAARLLFGHGHTLHIRARGLSVDVPQGGQDVFGQLDHFSDVDVSVTNSRAGPFTIVSFRLVRVGPHDYTVLVAAQANAADIAQYAADQLAGGFGSALAGLATGAIGGFDRPIPVHARMLIDTSQNPPHAADVQGDVAGLPAGPLAQIVTNALLSGL